MLGTNMLIHPLSRTDEHVEDEHVLYVQSLHFLLTDALLWTKRDILLVHHQYVSMNILSRGPNSRILSNLRTDKTLL